MLARMTLAEIRPTTITDAPAVHSLQARLLGEVIQPQDQAYDSARQVWNKAIDRYPSVIVRAADAAELHGKPVLMIMVVYAGDVEQGQRVLAPLRQLAAPYSEMVAPLPYHGIYALTAAGAQGHPSVARSGFFDALDGEALDAIVAGGQNETSPGAMIQFRPLGGAMARVPAGDTAFAHRQRNYMVTVASGWMAPEQEIEQRNWVESVWSQLRLKSNGVYSNFLGDEGESRIRQAYPGSTYERLVAVKRQYDPTNVFRLNQNIRP